MTSAAKTYPRFVAPRLRESLRDTPVVLIHGPRQSGKTTPAPSLLGYPAALARDTAARRATWYRDYVETQVQRDVLETT